MGLKLDKGTIILDAKVDKSENANNNNKFDFFEYKSNEGHLSLKLKNKNKLVIDHEVNGNVTILDTDFSDYFDKKHQFATTWNINDKKLILYIDGKKIKEKRML